MQVKQTDVCVRRIPRYVWKYLAAMLLTQLIVFYCTRLLLPYLPQHHMDIALDARIPFRPAWIVVYYVSFIFWIVSAVLILADSRAYARRAAASYMLAMAICGVIFLVYPTTITRPVPDGTDFFSGCARMLYDMDSPVNLFPSLHVLITYFCLRAAKGSRLFPKWFFPAGSVFLALVCLSILFLKQHVIADIPAGIAVGELSIRLVLFRREKEREKEYSNHA